MGLKKNAPQTTGQTAESVSMRIFYKGLPGNRLKGAKMSEHCGATENRELLQQVAVH